MACRTSIPFPPILDRIWPTFRIRPEKRPDHAIEVAKRVGMPLRMAAKVDLSLTAFLGT